MIQIDQKWVFLTATRNESKTISAFLNEIYTILVNGKYQKSCHLVIVDDFSIDDSIEMINKWQEEHSDLLITVINVPTNFGNQGALAYGFRQLNLKSGSYIFSLDSDGEDDLTKLPEMMEQAEKNPTDVIYTLRGKRNDHVLIQVLYRMFKVIFRVLTGKTFLPNNFMILPALYWKQVANAPYLPAYYSLSILKLGLPHMCFTYSRRDRYGGRSSQNIFNLITHAFVGLMVFHETLVSRVFIYTLLSSCFFIFANFFALFVKYYREAALPGNTALFMTVNFGFFVLMMALLGIASSLSIIFKLLNYYLAKHYEMGDAESKD